MKSHRARQRYYFVFLVLLVAPLLLSVAPTDRLCGQESSSSELSTDAASTVPVDREQTIYVPFAKLQEVFEREGRGVFLPYEEFQKLWNAARESDRQPTVVGPPVDSIITAIVSEATVQADVVRVNATLSIELLKQGWNTVPLRLKGAAIQSASIDGEPARITTASDGGYQLLVENDKDRSHSIELKLTYARAFDKSPGHNSVAFAAPQAPLNRWKIRIPQPGIKVNVTPMIAATEASEELTDRETEENDAAEDRPPSPKMGDKETEDTVLLAFVGSAPEVAIRWTPKAEGATGLTALTSVQARQEVFISEGAVRTRATLTYTISRAQLERLAVDVPTDYKVVNVYDPNVRKWEVQSEDADGARIQRVQVDLFEPATATQQITIELEKFLDAEQLDDLHTATFRAVDVGRQQGIIVVRVDPTLRAEATTQTGLQQVDQAELGPTLANQAWTFAYRYASMPFDLRIAVEKIQPRINVEQLVEVYLEPELMSLDVSAVYNIEQAGLFQLEFELPSGFEVLLVQGRATNGVDAAAVDSFHTEDADGERLIVNLSRKAIGKLGLWVQLQRRLSDPNLLTPTGNASTIDVGIPTANQQFMHQLSGKLVIHAPESLRVNPTTTSGLRPIALSEAYPVVPSCRDGRFPLARAALAFAFSDQPRQLDLSVLRRSPYVVARQMMVVGIDSGVVKYESQLFFEVQYSGVKSLRIDVPIEFASEIRNVSPIALNGSNANQTLRDAPMDPAPDDVADGYVAWSLTGETELIGPHVLRLNWEQKIDELQVGNSLDIAVPRVKPMGGDRAWGQVVVTKTETLDVQAAGEPVGLRPIDPVHDLMPDARVTNAASAMEFLDDWSLTLKATRYELEEVKRTSIERALVRTVVTRSDQHAVQALYRVRSARQRLAIKLPKGAVFDSQPARVNGSPVPLERGDQDILYVPLIGQDPTSEFVLELRYSVAGDHTTIGIPEFPDDPAVQKVYLAAYLPEELSLLSTSGPWTDEFTWRSKNGSFRSIPNPSKSDKSLSKWIAQGITTTPGPAFQTDGVMYLFSALRPAPPPDGSLKLAAMHENTLGGIVIGVLALVGLLFLRSTLTTKLIAVALLLMAAVASGVFAPMFGQQLLNLPTYAGLAIVGIGWSAWSILGGVKYFRSLRPKVRFNEVENDQGSESESDVAAGSNSDASGEREEEHEKQGGDDV